MHAKSIVAVAWLSAWAGSVSAQRAELRPIDRATVKLIAVRGAEVEVGTERSTGLSRVAATPITGHGSGLAITRRTVITAAHVIQGADTWAVILPGTHSGIAARPLYVDSRHDVAIMEVDARLPHVVPLRRVQRLQLSERLSASGYPLDVREPTPAAVTGELSRISRDGLLQLAMSVNPGNSGGPVIDSRGRVVGILSARGRPDQGVEGIAYAVPLDTLLVAARAAPRPTRSFAPAERDVARLIPSLLRIERTLSPNDMMPVLQRCLSQTTPLRSEADAVIAVTAWNVLLAHSESDDPARVREGTLEIVQDLVSQLAARTLTLSPHTRRHFPILRAIAAGRPSPRQTQ